MKILKSITEVRKQINEWKSEGYSVGLVPTMGYLHDGHKSLIEKAHSQNNKVIVSIFVNPIQFGPNEDYDKYPRDIEKDSKLCESAGADIIFNPEVSEMYPEEILTSVKLKNLANGLCGAKRPGHFDGVCTVVSKLFNIVNPTRAYFGEKDAQQLAVIKKMVKDLNFDIEVVSCPIVREVDGLAKSSRNTYLSQDERNSALVLNKSLLEAKKEIEKGETSANKIKDLILSIISSEPVAKVDYVEVVNFNTIKDTEKILNETLIAIAVYIGKTRLIDNIIIK
ncbi:pantoate--beta-alanine ligase [Hathewaya histolytica]|uniref:Pantothenate synthetase n=1 Tax=Hathewaya histolytica TaxID=1498 RepID=A0A4U9RMK6_HATHI|nr:pantoate--beta-alanine ligase [Hathewaya histolytica]VTQ93442.1 pantoate--beta-alanine ligase [Hathewaya histolytica]